MFKSLKYFKYFFFLVLLLFSLFLSCETYKNTQMGLMIPLYSCPSDDNGAIWDEVFNASKQIPIIVIWGVICKNDDYYKILNKFQRRNIIKLAYISTNNSKRNINDIKSEINFYSKYPINGFFFDEVSCDKKAEYFNGMLLNLTKEKNPSYINVFNSPYSTPEFLRNSNADIVVVFENALKDWQKFNLKNYLKISSDKKAVLIHHASSQYLNDIFNSLKKNVKWIFITDKEWDKLPSYFKKEVELLNDK